jgi:hypothetical protein
MKMVEKRAKQISDERDKPLSLLVTDSYLTKRRQEEKGRSHV